MREIHHGLSIQYGECLCACLANPDYHVHDAYVLSVAPIDTLMELVDWLLSFCIHRIKKYPNATRAIPAATLMAT